MIIERLDLTPRYSKIVKRGDIVYLAGLIAETWDADIAIQSQEVFNQIDELLAKAGTNKSRLLTMTCWIADFADYGVFNETYDGWIDTQNLPARATVKAELLDPTLKIEIMVTAAV
ncbi:MULTISPECIES: RidA family protein [Rhodobacterales]|uniref:RidA family protein n=1 Tax=Cognatishimia coralii TaxID=3083254 RepID=A0ABU8QKF0_9RHOB|nr:RidA family protein [Shimia aestuarii]